MGAPPPQQEQQRLDSPAHQEPSCLSQNLATRRDFLRSSAAITAAAALAPASLFAQTPPAFANIVENYRALGAKTPVKVTQLAPKLYLLQGVGGNMAALTGPGRTLLVDTSVSTAAPMIHQALTSIQAPPLTLLINTHWHFDHTDGNAALHNEVTHDIIAQTNTLKRLSAPQYMQALDVHFDAVPVAGRPTETFSGASDAEGFGQPVLLHEFAPAHTDSDLYVWFPESNVLHVADIWFDGFYPLIDYSTGGHLPGMVTAADGALKVAKPDTKIIPGHGPLGTRAELQAYRDMLAAVHERIAALKSSGKSVDEVVAAKPTAAFDAVWGNGPIKPDQFVAIAYKAT